MIRFTAMLLAAVLASAAAPALAAPAPASLTQSIRALLDAYAAKDVSGVMSELDSGPVAIMGTALPEVAVTPEEIRALLTNDFKGWDSSRFGEPSALYVRTSGDMAGVMFDVPWVATTHGTDHRFIIRIASLWHRSGGTWKLVHLLNSVPAPPQGT